MPGIQAVVEHRANGGLKITSLTLSDDFDSINPIHKPGVYQAKKSGNDVSTHHKSNGRITPENRVTVMVTNTEYDTPSKAAESAFKTLDKLGKKGPVDAGECDIFYAPVGSPLGMKNYNPSEATKGYAFAGLLANAMEQSKKQTGVEWLSERSGAVVLTQGLQTLANKGVSFEDKGHRVEMYLPPTDPGATIAAAQKLGMIADKNMAKGNGSLKARRNSLMINASRVKDKGDKYSLSDYGKDLATGGMAIAGVSGALALAASSVCALPVVATVGTATGAAGALTTMWGALKKSRERRG